MILFEQPSNNPIEVVYIKDFLKIKEIQFIANYIKKLPYEKSLVDGGENRKIRRSSVKWLTFTPEIDWLYQKVNKQIFNINEKIWKFNLISSKEGFQYTEYDAIDKGHYDWHVDIGHNYPYCHRKISVTIQLSSSDDYEGGDLEIFGQDPKLYEKGLGNATFFPSFLHHRVTPVTKGIRRSLVLWVGGAPLK